MSAPKPRPSAWDLEPLGVGGCGGKSAECICFRCVGVPKLPTRCGIPWCRECGRTFNEHEERCSWYKSFIEISQATGDDLMQWGSAQWAAVAWLAENEKRQGVLWEYLDSIRGLCTEADPYTLDTLPEDAMQLLCVNL